jgi:hypothetical protein
MLMEYKFNAQWVLSKKIIKNASLINGSFLDRLMPFVLLFFICYHQMQLQEPEFSKKPEKFIINQVGEPKKENQKIYLFRAQKREHYSIILSQHEPVIPDIICYSIHRCPIE